jgi:hypothetical protein
MKTTDMVPLDRGGAALLPYSFRHSLTLNALNSPTKGEKHIGRLSSFRHWSTP